jgi:heme O synthase-like polyprenyltransferase
MVPAKTEKPAKKSKTVWLNTLAIICAMIAALDPSMFAVLGPKGMAAGMALIAAANLINRFLKDPDAAAEA